MAWGRKRSGFGRLASRAGLMLAVAGGVGFYLLGATNDPRLDPARELALDVGAPVSDAVSGPFELLGEALGDMRGFLDVRAENRRLREDVVQLTQWRDVARRFEAENARLRALHKVTLAPKYEYVTAQVIGSSGADLAHSIVVNAGRGQGLEAGAVALDGGGVVGRVVATGENAARVLLLTDLSSRVPVTIEGTGEVDEDGERQNVVRGILVGDGSGLPKLEFMTATEGVKAGLRIVTSRDGGVFPEGLPVGVIERVGNKDTRVTAAADFERLDFVRVLLDRTDRTIDPDAVLIVNDAPRRGSPNERGERQAIPR